MKRRVRVYAGPSCPQDPTHGPLLEIGGLDELFCPAAAHAVPEGRSFFTQPEVLAAAARPAPDGPQGMTTRQTLDRSPRPATHEAAPEVSAPALGRRLPASDAASAAAAPDELTLRALWGDR